MRIRCLFFLLLLGTLPLLASPAVVRDTIQDGWTDSADAYATDEDQDSLAEDTAAATLDAVDLDSCQRLIASRVEEIINTPFTQRSQVAVYIYDLTDDKPIVRHNISYMLRPASNAKLITAITALSLLGSDYTYRTTLSTDGTLTADTLQGNVYIKAGYDPRFGRDDMAAFVNALKAEGIRVITGDVVFDISMKDTLSLGWGWCWDDDDANLSPLKYDGSGTFQHALKNMLSANGMVLCGDYRNGRIPAAAHQRVERSHSIDQILGRMMKKSDNMYAESMFYQIAAKSGVAYAGRKQAVKYINRLVRQIGLNPDNYKFADGSGLSLYNYASAELLVGLLRYAHQHDDIYNTLKPSLPVAGVDGTLRNRMKNGTAYGSVYAKTGTLMGVSTLSGYTRAANGHELCFSIMTQGIRTSKEGRAWQDRICQAMTKK